MWRKVRRLRVWIAPEWTSSDRDLALAEIFDEHVRQGCGFSIWKASGEGDKEAIVSILFELSGKTQVKHAQDYFVISEAEILSLGYEPVATPEGTTSTHCRASTLHHDLLNMSEEQCIRLANFLHERFSSLHLRVKKSEIKKALQGELQHFQESTVRERLRNACGARD